MKIRVCDICYETNEKIEKSYARVGYTNGFKLDLCANHKDWFKGKKSQVEAITEYTKLVNPNANVQI